MWLQKYACMSSLNFMRVVDKVHGTQYVFLVLDVQVVQNISQCNIE
jgi:ABC-type oligopeptide transport system ATPase subunit